MQQTGTAETLNCKSFVILHWMFHRSNWWVSPWHAVRHLMEITAQNEEFIRNVNTGVWKISFLFADRGTTQSHSQDGMGTELYQSTHSQISHFAFSSLEPCSSSTNPHTRSRNPMPFCVAPNARNMACQNNRAASLIHTLVDLHSRLSTSTKMHKQLDLCHPLFHYLQYEWWPKYCKCMVLATITLH